MKCSYDEHDRPLSSFQVGQPANIFSSVSCINTPGGNKDVLATALEGAPPPLGSDTSCFLAANEDAEFRQRPLVSEQTDVLSL